MTRQLKLMPDYGCWPLWDREVPGNVDPATLPISTETQAALTKWAKQFDSWLNQEYPPESRPKTPEEEAQFNAEGRRIWRTLRKELPDDEVAYFDVQMGKLFEHWEDANV